MAEFQPAIERTMKFEDSQLSGVVTREPNGCRARFGINENFHPELAEDFWTCDKDEVLSLAESIFEHEYWEKPGLAEIKDQGVADKIFDMMVNMGVHQGGVYAQRAVNFLIEHGGVKIPRVAEDGLLGEKSVAAVNSCDPARFIDVLRELSAAHYRHIAAVNPKQAPNLEAWLRRAAA